MKCSPFVLNLKVNRQEHKLTNGEEECTCTFVLVWLHGPTSGNLATSGIANICNIKSIGKVDPDITSFAKLAKQRIEIVSSRCSSASRKPASSEVSFSFYNVKFSPETKCPPRSLVRYLISFLFHWRSWCFIGEWKCK